jgi:conjugative relaxase-like TrwC/TraI family protein
VRLNVTPIGSARLSAGQVAKAVVEYLAGAAEEIPAPGLTDPDDRSRAVDPATAYYADSIEGPGGWLGHGASRLGLEGVVEHEALARVLEGRDPGTGERLLRAQGAADRDHLAVGRATRRAADGSWLYGLDDAARALGLSRLELDDLVVEAEGDIDGQNPDPPFVRTSTDESGDRWVSEAELERIAARSQSIDSAAVLSEGQPDDLLSLAQAGRLLGVSRQYLRGCCRHWEKQRRSIEALVSEGMRPRQAWMVAIRSGEGPGSAFKVTREEVAAFADRRQRPVVRVGYDVTLSTEKSVAVLALLSQGSRQRQVVAAIDAANQTALRFLEAHAAVGRRHGQRVGTEGLVVASFLHATSRALDPFPHKHNVVANAVIDEHGERRALDGRALYRHAPAAAALATAEMRWRLSSQLGVTWRRSPRGTWEADGVPDATVREFSTRRDEVDAALAELSEQLGRPLGPADTDRVVLATRAAKARTPVEELRAGWLERARATGLDKRALAACFGRTRSGPAAALSDAAEDALHRWLDGAVVAESPTFARGEVIEAICRWSVDGALVVLPPQEVLRLADRYLASERVIELSGKARRGRDSITRDDGVRIDATGGEPSFTTVAHARLEDRVLRAFDAGVAAGSAVVSTPTIEDVAGWSGLSAEQQAFVHSLCTRGMGLQCAVGRPGSGKTHSLAVAARAWEAEGYRVIGAAVKGEAARLLAEATGVRCETVAWWLAALSTGHERVDGRTVLLVDEASTLGTLDLSELLAQTAAACAAVRLVGDPAQHGAVAAGGMFAALCRRLPSAVPILRANHRQTTEVDRFVVDAVRAGRVAEAVAALRGAGQLTEVRDADGLYAAMVSRWLAARENGDAHPMIDRRNRTRRILNAVAHRVLQAEGQVASQGVQTSDGREFCVGDEVVARRPSRDLHPPRRPKSYVRNGSRGQIVAVDERTITVDFEGLGPIVVPCAFVNEHLDRRGRLGPGIDYGYALTSYAVQGSTLPTSSSAATAGARRRELYVNLTRGRQGNHLFMAAPADVTSGEGHLPRPPEDDVIAEVLAAVSRPDDDRCALEVDPIALGAAELRVGASPAELRRRAAATDPTDRDAAAVAMRAWRVATNAAARAAIAEPPPWVPAVLPPRPDVPWIAARWDEAVGVAASYRSTWEPRPWPGASLIGRVLGSPEEGEQSAARSEALRLIAGVWSDVALRHLRDYSDQCIDLSPVAREVIARPPHWLRRHLGELGVTGAFTNGIPGPRLAGFYEQVADFRDRWAVEVDDSTEARGIASLLGDRPGDKVPARQWEILVHRAEALGREPSRSRSLAP